MEGGADEMAVETYSQIMAQKINSMMEAAEELMGKGESQLAIIKLSRAITLQPQNAALFRRRAEAFLQLKDFHSAIINLQKSLSLSPGDGAEISPMLATAYFQYGQALEGEGEFGKALQNYQRGLELRPEERAYIMRRIGCLLSLQRYDSALSAIQEEMEADDSSADLHALRAQLNVLFGNSSRAYYDACNALSLEPEHTRATATKKQLEEQGQKCKNMAVQYSLQGKRSEAMKRITTAIESDPSSASYHVLRGALHRGMGDFNSAVDDFLTAMDKCDHDVECGVYCRASKQLVLTYNDCAVDCFRKKFFSEAVTLLNKAIKQEKKEKGLYLNRGDCFYRMNNLPFALADYRQALDLSPGNWDICCRVAVVCGELAVTRFQEHRHSEAHELFSTAIKHNPKVCRFYIGRAKAGLELKDEAGAEGDLLAALLLDPDNEECVPLLPRVFPGKTRESLLSGKRAEQAAAELKAATSYQHQDGEREEREGDTTGGGCEDLLGLDISLQFSAEVGGVVEIADDVEEVSAKGSGSERAGEETSEDGPCRSIPLPSPGDGESRVMPTLRSCLEEDQFHSTLYYCKKNSTSAVRTVLYDRCELGIPPPRLETVPDILFGGRTVFSSSSAGRGRKRTN